MVQKILKYSVNTWDQGFLDKLYASTNAVGVVSELILSVLNTNVSIADHLSLDHCPGSPKYHCVRH
jgi:hypothetical protein